MSHVSLSYIVLLSSRFISPHSVKFHEKTSITAAFFCLLAGFQVTASFAADAKPPASPEVAAAMQPYLDSYKLAGMICIIADKDGKVHYKNLIGFADVETKKPMSDDSVFWLASMSKMFVGASIMMLVDEGKVSLDDPVTMYIPQLTKWMVVEEKDENHVLLESFSSSRDDSAFAEPHQWPDLLFGASTRDGRGQHATQGARPQFRDGSAPIAAG